MIEYQNLLRHILNHGTKAATRAKLESTKDYVGAIECIGLSSTYDLSESFPIQTTKKIFFRGVVEELIWMLDGSTNVRSLQDKGVHIWDQWADSEGDIGPGYGYQWRRWSEDKPVDQIQFIIEGIIKTLANPNEPTRRRLILTAWNAPDIEVMHLPPCHTLSQFHLQGDHLSCSLYQRSADAFLGVPFNIAQYALLTNLLAFVTGTKPNKLHIHYGNVHIYTNHLEQVREVLNRVPREPARLVLEDRTREYADLRDLDSSLIRLEGYSPYPALKGEVAI